ncbi:unnamed protein product [Arctogadus glacialis]
MSIQTHSMVGGRRCGGGRAAPGSPVEVAFDSVPLDQGGPEAEDHTPWTRNGAPGWTGACGPDPLDQEWGTRLDWGLWTRPPGPGMGHQGGPEPVDQTPWTRNGAPGWTRG